MAALMVDAIALSLMGTALVVAAVALVVVPQRLAQRPGASGVLALHLDAGGTLRLWNRPIRARELLEALDSSEAIRARAGVLRLIPDPEVPWGVVRQAAAGLEATGLTLELQLP